MTLKQNVTYDNPADFTFNAADIEVAAGRAKLKTDFRPQGSYSEDFASAIGHSFDISKGEITGGQFRQLDVRPGNALVGATYTTSVNTSWLELTAVLNGLPSIVSEKLSCIGIQGVAYDDPVIGTAQTTGTVKFKYTPNYTGSPAGNVNLISLEKPGAGQDRIMLTHSGSGPSFRLTAFDASGATIYSTVSFGGYSTTTGVTDEIEFSWDTTTGTFRVFINGTLTATLTAGAYTRSALATILKVGATPLIYNTADGSFEDVVLFSDVQHTADYAPGYTLSETIYSEVSDSLPPATYPGSGNMKPVGPLSTTSAGSMRLIFNDTYWNGLAWVPSDGSYAQASLAADINSNLDSFPDTSSATVVAKSVLPGSNTMNSISQIDFDSLGESYSKDSPGIVANSLVLADAYVGFSVSDVVVSGNDELRFVIELKATMAGPSMYQYWDGIAWEDSDLSYAQSSTANEMNTNMSSLDISAGFYTRVVVLLYSDDGETTPEIGEHTLCYSFFATEPSPRECIVYGWLKEKYGAPLQGTVKISNLAPFVHTGVLVPKSEVETNTDPSDGYWEISVYETETIGKTYKVDIDYVEPIAKTVTQTITVPNQDDVNFADLTTGL